MKKIDLSFVQMLVAWFVLMIFATLYDDTMIQIVCIGFVGLLFACFCGIGYGRCDYRGYPNKLWYRIGRYVVASIILIPFVIQVGMSFQYSSEEIIKKTYGWVADLTLILYIYFYRPSNSSIVKKILKVVGMSFIIFSLFVMTQIKREVLVQHYWEAPQIELQNDYIMALVTFGIFVIGTILMKYGYKKSKVTENNVENLESCTLVEDQ